MVKALYDTGLITDASPKCLTWGTEALFGQSQTFGSTVQVVKGLYDAGFIANLYTYPAVPAAGAGVRFFVTVNTSVQQIESFVETLAALIALH